MQASTRPLTRPAAPQRQKAASCTEWQFEIRPNADLLPRQRQALLEALAKSVAAWPQWQVKIDPVRLESATALAGGQGAQTMALSQQTGAGAWCHAHRPCHPEARRATMKQLWPVVFPLVRPAVLLLAKVVLGLCCWCRRPCGACAAFLLPDWQTGRSRPAGGADAA